MPACTNNKVQIFGVPELPLIVISHPLGGISLEEVKRRAERAMPPIVNLIKGHFQ